MVTHQCRDARAAPNSLGRDGGEPLDDLHRGEAGTLAHLHSRQSRFERATVPLAVRTGPAHLVDVLAHRRPRLARAQQVLAHGTDVPGRAVSWHRPRALVERAEQREQAYQLLAL